MSWLLPLGITLAVAAFLVFSTSRATFDMGGGLALMLAWCVGYWGCVAMWLGWLVKLLLP